MPDVIVIGAGAIGLAAARELARDHAVLLLERGRPGEQASWAAAGMLCPHGEAESDGPLFRLGLGALATYRDFLDDLRAETGIDSEYDEAGTIVVASDPQEWAELCSRWEWQDRAGRETRRLSPGEVRELEPSLGMDVGGALYCPADHRLDPRRLLAALRKACRIRGVEIVAGAAVDEILHDGNVVAGVRSGRRTWAAGHVVVTAGAWSGQLEGLRPRVAVRPRKGQILALRSSVRFRHAARWRQYYIVPRRDGRLVVGATNEDCGYDRRLTLEGVSGLLQAAVRMSPRLASAEIVNAWSGLRPEASGGLPVIGRAASEGLVYAFGHYRNGILYAPATASIVGSLIRRPSEEFSDPAFSPMLFEGRASNRGLATHV